MKFEGVKCEPLTIVLETVNPLIPIICHWKKKSEVSISPIGAARSLQHHFLQAAKGFCDHSSASCPDDKKSEEYRVPATNDQADFGSLRILLTAALKSRQPH